MGRGKKLSCEGFRANAQERFKDQEHLSFEITNYVNAATKIDFTCLYHGVISVAPGELMRSAGCPKCSNENKKQPWSYWTKIYDEVHGNKFKYYPEKYVNSKTVMPIDCPVHGQFMQTPANHKIHGCQECGHEKRGYDKRLTFDDFKQQCESINPGKFEFIDDNYQGYNYRIGMKCKRCDQPFLALVKNLLDSTGYGCPHCKNTVIGEKNSLTSEEFYASIGTRHNNFYSYPKKDFNGLYKPFTFECPLHGEKTTKAINHYIGQKCNECGLKAIGDASRYTLADFLRISSEKHEPGRYNYDRSVYGTSITKIEIGCNKCGTYFHQIADVHMKGHGCPHCFTPDSKWEIEIKDFITSLGIPSEKNNSILKGKEIDIFIPTKKLGIECNGIYFHSTNGGNKDPNYHFNKTEMCIASGIQLLHIWEDEWRDRKEILKSLISSKLGIISNTVYARKCYIKEVSVEDANKFIEANHIQGFVGSSVKLGMYYLDELVSCMTFRTHEDHQWELNRFCTKINTRVIGGASKLLKYFIDTYNPEQIVSFANRRYSDGKLYDTLGFAFIHVTAKSYYYTDYKHTYPKNGFRLEKLKRKYPDFDPNKTENENAIALGFDRLYDSGLKKYLWSKHS
jgi:hypothetical protein